jgi:hypothetical protein
MEQPGNIEALKRQIVVQIADLSRLLGMTPSEEMIAEARGSFLKLALLLNEALDLKLP